MAKDKEVSPQEQIEALKAQIERLNSELADSKQMNKEAAQRASYFAGDNEEVPTGRKVKVKRCKNPWVRKEEDQVWEEVEVDTYLFTVDMPPVGGVQIMLDGEALQHGQTYEMTKERLITVKEIVYRLRAHEAAIHGSDEDIFRPRISKQISLRTGGIKNLPPNWSASAT